MMKLAFDDAAVTDDPNAKSQLSPDDATDISQLSSVMMQLSMQMPEAASKPSVN